MTKKIVHGLMALVFAAATAAIVIPAAMLQRGYWAIGGEWLLVVMAFFVSLLFITTLPFNDEEEDENE